MFYLLEPHATHLQWSDTVAAKMFIDAARERPDVDLATVLDWKPAERQVTDDLIRGFLRYGVMTSRGIAVDATDIAEIGRGDEIRKVGAEASEVLARHQEGLHAELMERLIPGWRAHGEATNALVDADTATAAKEADEDARRYLEAPVRPEVLAGWKLMAGRVPDPV